MLLRVPTHDNGGELDRHEVVTAAIGLAAYFCNLHSAWQRDSIENADRRLRQDLPGKTSLGDYSVGDRKASLFAAAGCFS
ncbi:hypothetical protein [Paracoccus siganidrum]|uniref:Uncharacterized protein n=1 Tax=Paracoccus siganidrum TaxID=1276757 RepID=A0A419A5R5_9RHOB|nr:hypothetical protein [Paracoccus siganidrum]RJL11451.1 hypothetical protein D3P05_13100 [Paracoccus siganidrum]RMC28851.1 hypothetical protein C9E82_20900 [Paracoccus siganidrum]